MAHISVFGTLPDEVIPKKLNIIIDECMIADITLKTIKKAWIVRLRYKYSYWDSLIIASALENCCQILYSKDMQSQQIIENKLSIINSLKV